MRTLELFAGKGTILLDDEDYSRVVAFGVWSVYRRRGVKYAKCYQVPKTVYLHRFVMNARGGVQVDHINLNGLDNQKENLRLCNNAQNSRNQGLRSTNTSGYKGVSYRKDQGVWAARICVDYRDIHLGFFDDPKDAHEAYCQAATKYHGAFARFK